MTKKQNNNSLAEIYSLKIYDDSQIIDDKEIAITNFNGEKILFVDGSFLDIDAYGISNNFTSSNKKIRVSLKKDQETKEDVIVIKTNIDSDNTSDTLNFHSMEIEIRTSKNTFIIKSDEQGFNESEFIDDDKAKKLLKDFNIDYNFIKDSLKENYEEKLSIKDKITDFIDKASNKLRKKITKNIN